MSSGSLMAHPLELVMFQEIECLQDLIVTNRDNRTGGCKDISLMMVKIVIAKEVRGTENNHSRQPVYGTLTHYIAFEIHDIRPHWSKCQTRFEETTLLTQLSRNTSSMVPNLLLYLRLQRIIDISSIISFIFFRKQSEASNRPTSMNKASWYRLKRKSLSF